MTGGVATEQYSPDCTDGLATREWCSWEVTAGKPVVAEILWKVEAGGAKVLASKTFSKTLFRFMLGSTVVLLGGTVLLLGRLENPGMSYVGDFCHKGQVVASEARGILPVFTLRLV